LRILTQVIDIDGYRPNVGIILSNDRGRLLWARRIGQDAWQFPQGGIRPDETPEEALFRELNEDLGLFPEHVEIMGQTQGWLRYRLPQRLIRHHDKPVCIGQKQKWFLMRLIAEDSDVCLSGSPRPEFDHWRWVSYWYPIKKVVPFKRKVYARALRELAPLLLRGSPDTTSEQGTVDSIAQGR
jgi:putative (di)nucleoside polyphosphate hydrolase